MTKRKYTVRRMTEPLDIRHFRAHLWSFAFLIHEKPVKLTTKNTKDTKNLLAGANDPLSHNRNLADIVRPL
jgi:hypothetical protein